MNLFDLLITVDAGANKFLLQLQHFVDRLSMMGH